MGKPLKKNNNFSKFSNFFNQHEQAIYDIIRGYHLDSSTYLRQDDKNYLNNFLKEKLTATILGQIIRHLAKFDSTTFSDISNLYQYAHENIDTVVDNIYIDMAGKYKEFSSAQAVFERTTKDGSATTVTYNTFIKVARLCNEFSYAQMAFQQAKQNNKTNPTTYILFIKTAIANKQFHAANNAFDIAKTVILKPKDKTVICNIFISEMAEAGRLDDAKNALDWAVENDVADHVSYISFIDIAGKKNHAYAKISFDLAVKNKKTIASIYNAFIKIAGENHRFDDAKNAFKAITGKENANTTTYSSFIKTAALCEKFEYAEAAFNMATVNNKADKIVCNIFLNIARDYKKFDAAQNAFNWAVKNKKADVISYTCFIQLAGEFERFDAAESAFKQAIMNGQFNFILYSKFIAMAGKYKKFSVAKEAFDSAVANKMDDPTNHSIFIKAAGNCGKFNAAHSAFKLAVKKNKANSIVYNVFIKLAGEFGKFEIAQRVFYQAINNHKETTVTYNTFIHLAINCKKFDIAKLVIKQAIQEKKADDITHRLSNKLAIKMGGGDEEKSSVKYQTAMSTADSSSNSRWHIFDSNGIKINVFDTEANNKYWAGYKEAAYNILKHSLICNADKDKIVQSIDLNSLQAIPHCISIPSEPFNFYLQLAHCFYYLANFFEFKKIDQAIVKNLFLDAKRCYQSAKRGREETNGEIIAKLDEIDAFLEKKSHSGNTHKKIIESLPKEIMRKRKRTPSMSKSSQPRKQHKSDNKDADTSKVEESSGQYWAHYKTAAYKILYHQKISDFERKEIVDTMDLDKLYNRVLFTNVYAGQLDAYLQLGHCFYYAAKYYELKNVEQAKIMSLFNNAKNCYITSNADGIYFKDARGTNMGVKQEVTARLAEIDGLLGDYQINSQQQDHYSEVLFRPT